MKVILDFIFGFLGILSPAVVCGYIKSMECSITLRERMEIAKNIVDILYPRWEEGGVGEEAEMVLAYKKAIEATEGGLRQKLNRHQMRDSPINKNVFHSTLKEALKLGLKNRDELQKIGKEATKMAVATSRDYAEKNQYGHPPEVDLELAAAVAAAATATARHYAICRAEELTDIARGACFNVARIASAHLGKTFTPRKGGYSFLVKGLEEETDRMESLKLPSVIKEALPLKSLWRSIHPTTAKELIEKGRPVLISYTYSYTGFEGQLLSASDYWCLSSSGELLFSDTRMFGGIEHPLSLGLYEGSKGGYMFYALSSEKGIMAPLLEQRRLEALERQRMEKESKEKGCLYLRVWLPDTSWTPRGQVEVVGVKERGYTPDANSISGWNNPDDSGWSTWVCFTKNELKQKVERWVNMYSPKFYPNVWSKKHISYWEDVLGEKLPIED